MIAGSSQMYTWIKGLWSQLHSKRLSKAQSHIKSSMSEIRKIKLLITAHLN